jgi:hypothetical protein
LGELPEPMARFLIAREKSRLIDTLDIEGSKKLAPPTLWDGLRRGDDALLLLFSCFGQDRHKAVKLFLGGFRTLLADFVERGETVGFESIASAFVYDADEVTVAEKLALWRTRYLDLFKGIGTPNSASWISWESESVGWCVFRAFGTERGQLEDVLLPLLHVDAKLVHDDVHSLMTKHWPADIRGGKQRKAAITAAGQVSQPGDSMAMILAKTPHLGEAVLTADPTCQEMIAFFLSGCA